MPSLATTNQGPLGCGSYVCRLINDGRVIYEASKVTSVTWGRRLDEPSTATLTLPVQGTDLAACCQGVNRIEPLRTEVIVERNGLAVWQGWLMRDVVFRRDNIVINAHDILKWTERRVLDDNHTYVGQDLTNIALGFLGDSNLADLPFVITSQLSGILADRTVLQPEYKYASEPLRELYETGLDITVVAGQILLGPETSMCDTLQLRDQNIDGDPEIKLDGDQRATRVIVKGANGIVAIYPPADPDVCFRAADHVSSDEAILDQASADRRAIELYERLSASHPYYLHIPQGSGLSPDTPIHVNALVPGNLFQVYSEALCLPIGQALRLTAVDAESASESEQIRVTFEPLGDDIEVAA